MAMPFKVFSHSSKNSWTSWDFERERDSSLLWIDVCVTIVDCSYVAFNLSQTSFEVCNVLIYWICQSPQWKIKSKRAL